MATLILVAALCVALLLSLWRWEAEKERREQAEREVETWRQSDRILQDELRRLRALEEAAYGMYSVLCTGFALRKDDPQVQAYERASDAYWKEELPPTPDLDANRGYARGNPGMDA